VLPTKEQIEAAAQELAITPSITKYYSETNTIVVTAWEKIAVVAPNPATGEIVTVQWNFEDLAAIGEQLGTPTPSEIKVVPDDNGELQYMLYCGLTLVAQRPLSLDKDGEWQVIPSGLAIVPSEIQKLWEENNVMPEYTHETGLTEIEFRIPNGRKFTGSGFRFGFTTFIVENRGNETLALPNPELDEETLFELFNHSGALIHAVNLGLVDMDTYNPNWYQEYLEYITAHPDARYSISYQVKVGKTYVEKTTQKEVNPALPVRMVVLPSVVSYEDAWETSNKIYGGDPRAAFNFRFSQIRQDFHDFDIDANGQLTLYLSRTLPEDDNVIHFYALKPNTFISMATMDSLGFGPTEPYDSTETDWFSSGEYALQPASFNHQDWKVLGRPLPDKKNERLLTIDNPY